MSLSTFGVLALAAASASASHNSFNRRSHHARIAGDGAPGWKRGDAVSGVAYYGYQNNTQNACGTYSKDSDMIIGVGPNYYGDMNIASSKCFQHITVSLASDASKSIDVTLTDACQDCGESGNVYLSTAAFEALSGGSLDAGVLDVTWSFGGSSSGAVSAPVSGGSDSTGSGQSSSPPSKDEGEDDEDCDDDEEGGSAGEGKAPTTPAAAPTSSKAATPAKPTTANPPAKESAPAKTSSSTPAKSTGNSNEGWKLTKKLEGSAFLDFFNYDSNTNDNGGVAQYVNGVKEGLAFTSGKQVILAVDNTEKATTRNALRMVSKQTFNAKDQNLFIFDIAAMPAVCGTWPAVWFTGANWPFQGEIDVVEGVSLYTQNIYSIHTGSGCTIPTTSVSAMSKVSIVKSGGNNCDANVDTAGCGFSDHEKTTFGPGFNAAGGGVFALQFDTDGIKMWFFQTGSVPSDISSLAPNPSTWGTPRMSVPTSSCAPTTFFSDLMMIVDTNLGGTFTEGVWAVDGAGGQSKSCKTQTGVETAAEYVRNHGSEFGDDAQWKINGFYIYNQ